MSGIKLYKYCGGWRVGPAGLSSQWVSRFQSLRAGRRQSGQKMEDLEVFVSLFFFYNLKLSHVFHHHLKVNF